MAKHLLIVAAIALAVSPLTAGADENKPQPPRIAMCVPLAVAPGISTRIVVRGWDFDGATEVRASRDDVAVKLLSVGSANVPNGQDAKQIGDRQAELEIGVAADSPPGEVMLTIESPAGASQPHPLWIGGEFPIAAETEPNDGFRQPQSIELPQIIDGQIHNDQNVDVFAFELSGNQQIDVDVVARRRGSGLDSILTLFDSQGNIVAVNDDQADTVDSRLTPTLTAGRYLLSLQDAHDHGGPAHPYRLIVRPAK